LLEHIKIRELPNIPINQTLEYKYLISNYYDVKITHHETKWTISFILNNLEEPLEKVLFSDLFEHYIDNPIVYVAEFKDKQVGWIELEHQLWNNRVRIWEILVHENFRRKGIGTQLINKAVEFTRNKKARMIVLETQSWNPPAIDFYLKNGFKLIGLDTHAYTNQDIEDKNVRLELGLIVK
jgi:ribosomal protein S18 acetylase RimI-like enzyme